MSIVEKVFAVAFVVCATSITYVVVLDLYNLFTIRKLVVTEVSLILVRSRQKETVFPFARFAFHVVNSPTGRDLAIIGSHHFVFLNPKWFENGQDLLYELKDKLRAEGVRAKGQKYQGRVKAKRSDP